MRYLLLLAFILCARLGFAHDLGLTRIRVDMSSARTRVTILTPLSRIMQSHSITGSMPAAELDAAIRSKIYPRTQVPTDLKLDGTSDLLTWSAEYPSGTPLEFSRFDESSTTARTLVSTYQNGILVSEQVLGGVRSQAATIQVLEMGVNHILSGFDHLLFVVGIALVGTGWRAYVKLLTTFSVAHMITLAAASLGAVGPNPRIVEPLIALSIVALAIEGIRMHRGGRPSSATAILAFGFGLIHGLGFAGGFMELGLRGRELVLSLIPFGLGIEAGQLVVLLPVVGLLAFARARSQPWLTRLSLVSSIALGMIGCFWLVERVLQS